MSASHDKYAECCRSGHDNLADIQNHRHSRQMSFTERTLYASAGAWLAAGFIGLQDLEWRTVYYGAFVVGAVAAVVLSLKRLKNRRVKLDGS